MYDNEEHIDPITLPTAQYQLRRIPQRIQHYDRLAMASKQAPLRRKHVVKAKQLPRRPLAKIVVGRKTPPSSNRSSVLSPSTSPYSVVVELTDPSSSPSSDSDVETNTYQHSSPVVHTETTLPIVPIHNQISPPHQHIVAPLPDNRIRALSPQSPPTIPQHSEIEEVTRTPVQPQRSSFLSTSIAAIPRITTQLFAHLADNITPPTISPQNILNTLLRPHPQNTTEPQLHLQTSCQRQSIQTTQRTIIYQQPHTSYWNVPLSRSSDHSVPSPHIQHSSTCPHAHTSSIYSRQQSLPINNWNTSSIPISSSPSYPSLPPANVHQQTLYPSFPHPPFPQLHHVQTQTLPPPLMIHQTIQTESIYFYDHCWVSNQEYTNTPFTLHLRSLFMKKLILYLRKPIVQIALRTGKWPATMFVHAFQIIPTILIPSLVSFINACKTKIDPSQLNQQYIPHPLIRPFLYHLHTLEYACNNVIFNSILIPLTYYTNTERWPYTFTLMICLLYRTLKQFYEELPNYIQTCGSSSLFTSSTVFTSFTATITNILLSHSNVQHKYFHDLFHSLPSRKFRQTLPTYPYIPVAPHEDIPAPLYDSIFTPTIENINQQYTFNELANLVINPDSEVNIAHIDQFLYYRCVSAPIHPFKHIKLLLTSPLTSIYNPVHQTKHTHTDPSPTSYEAYESLTSEDTMANPTSDQSSNTGIPSHIPATSSRDNPSPPRRALETSPPLTQEGVNRTVQNRIDALWNNQIEPELTRSTDRMQKHLDDVHQQMVVISETFTEQLNRMSSQTPPNERRSRSPSARNQHTPSFLNQYQTDHTRQSHRLTNDRHNYLDTEQRVSPVCPSTQIIQPPAYETNPSSRELTRSFRQQPIDLREFLTGTRHPMLTEEDIDRFARKSPDKLTDQQINAFAEQLEGYLTHDPNNQEFLAEGNALRKLIQYTRPRRLGAWLQLYANPSIRFRFPKTEFWQRKYDENAHLCMPQPNYKPDISECLEQLTRTLAIRLDATPTHNFRNNQQTNNNTFNNNPYPQLRNFTPNTFRNMTQNPQNFTPRNNFLRNDYNRNEFNRQSFNRNEFPRNDYSRNTSYVPDNNRPNYSQQGQNNNSFSRNNFDNRPQYQQNSPSQQFRQYPQQQQQQQQSYQQQPQRQQQPQQFQQRPNNWDNRNPQFRNNDTRQQNFQRRNNNYNQNSIDDDQQDMQETHDIQHDIEDITSLLPPPATNCIDVQDDQDEQDF